MSSTICDNCLMEQEELLIRNNGSGPQLFCQHNDYLSETKVDKDVLTGAAEFTTLDEVAEISLLNNGTTAFKRNNEVVTSSSHREERSTITQDLADEHFIDIDDVNSGINVTQHNLGSVLREAICSDANLITTSMYTTRPIPALVHCPVPEC